MKKLTRKHLEPFLARYATDGRVLDLGAGRGTYDRFFPNRLTVDIDPARKPDVVADAHSLPFEDVLAPGGMLILSTRFVFPLHDTPHDYWRYTKYGLLKLFERWEVIELQGETDSFSTIGALLQRISFQSVMRANKPSKGFLLVLIALFDRLNWMVKQEYGNIRRTRDEHQIMPTGYYLAARRSAVEAE